MKHTAAAHGGARSRIPTGSRAQRAPLLIAALAVSVALFAASVAGAQAPAAKPATTKPAPATSTRPAPSTPAPAPAAAAPAAPATPPVWAVLDVPDSSLNAAVQSTGVQFETIWNQLVLSELRLMLGVKAALVPEEAARLLDLQRKVAKAETDVFGTHIAQDALALRYRWGPQERDVRIHGAMSESLAVLAQAARKFPQAERHLRDALSDYRQLEEKRREAWVLGSLGVVAYLAGDLAKADSLYRIALDARRQLGDDKMVGNTLNALGITTQQRRRNAEAKQWFQMARDMRQKTGERAALGSTYNLLGLAWFRLASPESARANFDSALVIAYSLGDSGRVAEVVINQALMLGATGDPAGALKACDRALAIVRQRKDPRGEANVHRTAAEVLRQLGRFAEATDRIRAAIALDEAVNDPRTLAEDLLTLGRIAVVIRDPAIGRPPLERALKLADSLRSAPLQAAALNNLSSLAGREGDARGAVRLGRRALERAVAAGDSALVHDAATTLNQLAADRGDWAEARGWAERAAVAGNGLGDEQRASDIGNLGDAAVGLGKLDEAEKRFRASLEIAERVHAPDLVWPALLGLGDVAERRGDFPTALAYDRRAASLIDTLRTHAGGEAPSISVLARRLFAFEALIHLLGKLEPRYPDSGYAAESFQWAERARARAFLDLIEGASVRGQGPGAAASAVRPLTLAEARARIDSGREALLEYSLGDSSSSLWLVTKKTTRHVILPPRPALRARAEILRRGLADAAGAESKSTRDAARALYRMLIEPVEADLKDVDRLVISPDDALTLIPFEVLLTRDVADGPAPAGSYLVERATIAYVPSATVLANLRAPGKAGPVVALGDPHFAPDSSALAGLAGGGLTPRSPLVPLPNTGAEVMALQQAAGSRKFVMLTGDFASRDRLLALPELPQAEVVHLATHGVADENEPAHSGLWLAAAGGVAPGFLSVGDILGLKLNAELVTLSACETGLGKLERGEGVLGLTRAFLVAGSRSVIVSLWKVNDRSTALLMERFYKGLLQKGMEREDALAEAKRALMKEGETRSPFYWAPFVLVGEGGKVR